MRFEVSGVDHQLIRRSRLRGERGKDFREDAFFAPPHIAVVERLVGAVRRKGVVPLQALAQDRDDAADDDLIVAPRLASGPREKRLHAGDLFERNKEQVGRGETSDRVGITRRRVAARTFMGPDPRA